MLLAGISAAKVAKILRTRSVGACNRTLRVWFVSLSSERLAIQHLVIFRWAAERCGAGSPRMVLTEWSTIR